MHFLAGLQGMGVDESGEASPFIVLRLTSNPLTRQIWPHDFQLFYQVGC